MRAVLAMCGVMMLSGCSGMPPADEPGGPAPVERPVEHETIEPSYGRIPSGAERVASGYGKVTYRAPEDGRVWVGNDNRRYEILSRNVKRGDRIEVMPERDLIEFNEQPIYQQNLERSDKHAVFFRASRSGWGSGWGSGPAPYAGIPRSAESVASGRGRVEWRAESRGTVWIGNDRLKSVVVSHAVNVDDLVEVDPSKDQVKLNGRVIFNKNMESKHEHSIFFR